MTFCYIFRTVKKYFLNFKTFSTQSSLRSFENRVHLCTVLFSSL